MQQETLMIYLEKGGYETMKVRDGFSRYQMEQKQNAVGGKLFFFLQHPAPHIFPS